MREFCILFLFITFAITANAQTYTRRDSLQGGLRPERTSFDVQHYDLNITVNPDERYISGYNNITFKIVENTKRIQLDLFENMKVDSIIYNNKKLAYKRDNDAVFITFYNELKKGSEQQLRFYYSGKPVVARNAPWDGGFVFRKDNQGKPWIGVAVQGTGASLWYPVKDHQTDEPDNGATIKVAVPNGLMNVSNGRFTGSEDLGNGYTRWDWEVKNPINNYTITLNIADYAHIHDNINGLDLDYYVLKDNEEKARKHFEEVKPMIECFESKFGKYPFYEDGYKLVETPYLGMEHQSAVAYGNNYKKGYRGMDMSYSGVGMLFDYITIHESGHEWFGNSITSNDIADMWIHESFTTYSETVFVECRYGYEKAMKYINGQRMNVQNDKPIIGIFGVNKEGSGDMYFKGSLMLNTLRHIVNDDDKWWAMLLKYANTYRKQIIDSETVINFFNTESGINLTPVFNQYLKHTTIPVLEFKMHKGLLCYRWKTDEKDFAMPVDIVVNDNEIRLQPTTTWDDKFIDKVEDLDDVEVLANKFYIKVQKL
ncbi:M1 family metallopeptidase [Flavobacterium salilacus subsp. salilacus]|uniref:M1 family metallopeptidase n=1 Tax=Flavobacterium TaxID=237 RepID=UPI00107555BA|nr:MULTISPECIES: M1 family metallopeptidase [Flavobacterium]KAF2519195.1 M1 family metallopeptidase [Flavobacterium salilacus subsp. salilacus]MBE1613375.1 M1 family metallopeptidase [Flavobacterium sp. SaA2.13]